MIRELYKPGQYPLLRGVGKTGMTGPEIKSLLGSHIILYQDDFGSHRFVYHINGKSISVLQVIGFESPYIIANVYTENAYRRQGYAELLIKKAREVLGKIIHANPKDQSVMGKAWAKAVGEPIMDNGKDIIVNNIEFAAGQEPEYSDTFASLVRANYTIRGKKLAQILGKQMRVLDKHLRHIDNHRQVYRNAILSQITEDDDVLVTVARSIKNFIIGYLISEFSIEGAPRLLVENASESDYPYSVSIDSVNQSITVETEFDVMAE